MCDAANQILNEDDLDYSDTESDLFLCEKPNYKQNFSCSRRKGKRRRHPCTYPDNTSQSSRAPKPTKGVNERRRKRHKRHCDKQRCCYKLNRKERKLLHRMLKCCDLSSHGPDEDEYQHSKLKQCSDHRSHKNDKNLQNECVACPVHCHNHKENNEHKTRKPQKRYQKPKLSYSHLGAEKNFIPDFSFAHRSSRKNGRRKASPTRREHHRNNFRDLDPHRRCQKHVNPFLANNRQKCRMLQRRHIKV